MDTHDEKQEQLAYRCRGNCNTEVKKPVFCERCNGAYHPKCATFHKVVHENKTIKICKACLTAANPLTPIITTRSRTSSTSSNKSTLSSSGSVPNYNKSSTLDEILKAVQATNTTMTAFIATQNAHNAKIDAFMLQQQAENAVVNEKVAALSEEVRSHHVRCTTSDRALLDHCQHLEAENKTLKTQLQHREQRDSQYDLVITGVPEVESENLYDLLLSVANLLQVELSELDIGQVNRIRSTNPTTDQPRFIYASLESRAKRNQLLTKAKETTNLTARQIRPTFPATLVRINEWQTPSLNSLYRKAKETAHRLGYKFTWFSHGKIRVRRDGDSAPIVINNEEDLTKIIAAALPPTCTSDVSPVSASTHPPFENNFHT